MIRVFQLVNKEDAGNSKAFIKSAYAGKSYPPAQRVERMIDKDAQSAANRFMTKFTGNGFVMSRSKNTSENYTKKKQMRDSIAVSEFTKTEVFKNILKLR